MQTVVGDIWEEQKKRPGSWIAITTNGSINRNGECVMGRGVALQARQRFSTLPLLLGQTIEEKGNRVHQFVQFRVLTFPVKVRWFEPAKQWLIQRSCQDLMNWLNQRTENNLSVLIPHAGCKNGQLDWKTHVKPIFELEFGNDPRIIVVDKEPS